MQQPGILLAESAQQVGIRRWVGFGTPKRQPMADVRQLSEQDRPQDFALRPIAVPAYGSADFFEAMSFWPFALAGVFSIAASTVGETSESWDTSPWSKRTTRVP